MPLKKELRDGLEEIRLILSGLGDIPPQNHANIARKALASKALEDIVPLCVSMLENILWCDKYNTDLNDEMFPNFLEDAKNRKKIIENILYRIDNNPITA